MFKEFFANSDLMVWPVVSLLIFAVIFIGMLAFVFFGLRDKEKLDAIAALPFAPETEIETKAEGRAV